MRKVLILLLVAAAVAAVLTGCKGEQKEASIEPATFQFTIYPGSRYLAQLTELTKQAHKTLESDKEIPPTAIYDTDAPVDTVAQFYAKAYGFGNVAPDVTNNLSAAKPPAYYRTGDIAADVKSIESLLKKMNVNVDVSKAAGHYRAAEIESKPNRPHVTVQRPYFDLTTGQVVDRTIILMAR
jgi:hypothetical protein